MPFQSSLSLYQYTLLPICTVVTVRLLYAIPILTVIISVHNATNFYGSHSRVSVCHSNLHCHYICSHCYQYVRQPQLLQQCASIAVQLLYAIPIFIVTISLHTVTNMYGSKSCYSIVPVLLHSYCKPIESSLSLYQCTLLPICTVAIVQLLYAIPILTVTISVHTFTNMYCSHSCYNNVTVLQQSYCMPFQSSLSLYQCTLLPICTVPTAVTAM